MEKNVYLPNISDHAYAVAAAMRAYGIPAEVLAHSREETLAIGLALCRGRECLPCFLVVGDLVRACRSPGFDPGHAAFFMPGSPGPCRFGQYRVLLRVLLDREGFADAEILSPTSENSYRGFGAHPRALRLLVWSGIVATDLLL